MPLQALDAADHPIYISDDIKFTVLSKAIARNSGQPDQMSPWTPITLYTFIVLNVEGLPRNWQGIHGPIAPLESSSGITLPVLRRFWISVLTC